MNSTLKISYVMLQQFNNIMKMQILVFCFFWLLLLFFTWQLANESSNENILIYDTINIMKSRCCRICLFVVFLRTYLCSISCFTKLNISLNHYTSIASKYFSLSVSVCVCVYVQECMHSCVCVRACVCLCVCVGPVTWSFKILYRFLFWKWY